MVLYCIARVVGETQSVRGQDFVTQLAVPRSIEPEHATAPSEETTVQVLVEYDVVSSRLEVQAH